MPSKRILVVDDDSSIRRLVSTVLKREHYDVHTATGGRQALSMIERTQYDVVVLDLMMPEVNGFDVLEMLAIRVPHVQCVVIMSAASPFEVATALNSNVFAALEKPFDIAALVSTVARCIDAACGPAAPRDHIQPLPQAA
jgi:DNA-binding NtrC family response regulator